MRRLKQIESKQLIEIGQRLYECRKARGWTQAYVAEKVDVSVNTMSAIENGLQQFSLTNLLRFSELYETSTDYILSGHKQEFYDCELFHKLMKLPPSERIRLLRAIDVFYEL